MSSVLSSIMVSNKVLVGFDPPVNEDQQDLKAEEILDVVREFGASYPSEICGEIDIGKETCYRKLRFLVKQGKLKRISLDGMETVPDWLKPRINSLWARGLKGEAIRRMAWYVEVKHEGKK